MHWKYTSIELGLYEDPKEQLAAAGAQGWELVSALTFSELEHNEQGFACSVDKVRYILKSPIPASRKRGV